VTALATVDSAVRQVQRERDKHDFYVEPAWAVEALLNVEGFQGEVYDPACGTGTIVEVCKKRGLDAWGTDLIARGYVPCVQTDFSKPVPDDCHDNVQNIVCNPPFRHAEVFIQNALLRAKFKVAMLLRLSFLEGQKRRALFEKSPLARVWVFSRRVSMPPGGQDIPAKGGAVAFCWLVWDHHWRGPPQIGWLP
jgi:hypothetical protein